MYLVEMYILLQSNNSIVTATDTALVPVGYLMCPENEDSSLTASYPHPHARCSTTGRYSFGAPLTPPPPQEYPAQHPLIDQGVLTFSESKSKNTVSRHGTHQPHFVGAATGVVVDVAIVELDIPGVVRRIAVRRG